MPGVKSVLCKQQYTVTFCDCNYLAQVIVFGSCKNLMCYCTDFALFYYEFNDSFQVYKPRGFWRGHRFNGGFFALLSMRSLLSEFYGKYR